MRINKAIILIFLFFMFSMQKALAEEVVLYPDKDSWVSRYYPYSNFGGSEDLRSIMGGDYLWLIGFDLSSLPQNIYINETKFYYCPWGAHGRIQINEITSPWSEYTVTWNNKPSMGGLVYKQPYFPIGSNEDLERCRYSSEWNNITVTSFVRNHYESDKYFDIYGFAWSDCIGAYWWTIYSRESGCKPRLYVKYTPLIVHQVNSSIVAPSDYYLEENNTVIIWANVTGTEFNITYNDNSGSIVYLTFNDTTEEVSVPFFRHYNLSSGNYSFIFSIYPYNESSWNGFNITVEKPDGSVDNYTYNYPDISIGYRYPLYNFSIDYPKIMYIEENNTIKFKANKNQNYQYAKANVKIKYRNQNALVYFKDNIDQLVPILVSLPFEKTYENQYQDIEADFIVYPYEGYEGYVISGEYETIYTPLTSVEFSKNESLPEDDPDYIEVRFRYSPITYPLEDKTLVLQFHYFSGDWDEFVSLIQNCTYNELNNVWTCPSVEAQNFLNQFIINCRNCYENSTYQLVQYWTNKTDCIWLSEILNGVVYWKYPISMILLDRNVCQDYTVVTNLTNFTYKGSFNSLDNRRKFVFFNQTRVDSENMYYRFSDAIGLQSKFNGKISKTQLKDLNDTVVSETNDVWVSNYTIEDKKVTFYIANKNPSTIWVDEIRIVNHAKWSVLQYLTGLYTTHSGKRVDVSVKYDSLTDTIIVTPLKPKQKIPIEPATGSNILEILQGYAIAGQIILLVPFIFIVSLLMFVVRLYFGGSIDHKVIIESIIAILIAIILIGFVIEFLV